MKPMIAKDTPIRALSVALTVAVVCALAVSLAADTLRPLYLANLEQELVGRLMAILDALSAQGRSFTIAEIETRVVRLDDGAFDDDIDPDQYDARKASRELDTSIALAPDDDIAGIRRRANPAVVYLARQKSGRPDVLILPVYGIGYQSALLGYLALDGNGRDILALRFYEQGETPGLGSRIQEPDWEALWQGKRAFADDGSVTISVGGSGHAGSTSRVDGISGATRTTQGVDALVRFWLGENGFGPFLARAREGDI